MKHGLVPALGAIILAAAGPAVAQSWSVEGEVGVVSDYRYRGYSLSDGDPALQAGGSAWHASGWYVTGYASSVAAIGDGSGPTSDIELTAGVGWSGEIAGWTLDLGLMGYGYPGARGVDYVELPVSVARSFGPASWTLGYAHAPAQAALDESNRYLWTGLELAPETWPVTFGLKVGRERGAFAAEPRVDVEATVSRDFGAWALSLGRTEADDEPGAWVAGVFRRF